MSDQNTTTQPEDLENILEGIPAEESVTQPQTGAGSTNPPTDEGDDVAKLWEALAKANENLARANADYQNLLRRTEKDRIEMSSYFTQNFAKKLLPTLDNLDRVVSGTPAEFQTGAVYDGVKQAAAGLSKVLESMGVKSFASLWAELDPHFHEALSQWPGPSGKIIAEFEKGYLHGDEVIRHAKVVVGNGEEAATANA